MELIFLVIAVFTVVTALLAVLTKDRTVSILAAGASIHPFYPHGRPGRGHD